MLKFPVLTDNELSDVVPRGEYTFKIIEAKEYEKSGHLQMSWVTQFKDNAGGNRILTCYFKFDPSSAFCMRQIKHALLSIGREDLWKAGQFEVSQVEKHTGKYILKVRKSETKPNKNGELVNYPERNEVESFVIPAADLTGALDILSGRRQQSNKEGLV